MLETVYDELSMKIYQGSNFKYLPINYPFFPQERKEEHEDEPKGDSKEDSKGDSKKDTKEDSKKEFPFIPYKECYLCLYCRENYPAPPRK